MRQSWFLPWAAFRSMRALRRGSVFWLSFFWLFLACDVSPGFCEKESLGDYHDSPVFFEMFFEEYADDSNLSLFVEGKLNVPPFGIRDIKDFSWVAGTEQDLSSLLQWERFQYLLPFINSHDEVHREFAREWFEKWHHLHHEFKKPNRGAWDPMSAAIRAMVLVFYLKQEERENPRNEILISLVRQAIYDHQNFLSHENNFDYDSNHGMWEAVGLIETNRVFPNSEYMALGNERLFGLVKRSVSSKGIHKEHSPAYHFNFLQWLLEYIAYVNSLKSYSWTGMAELEKIGKAMMEASYFMQDHHGNVPMIGDTDESTVKNRFLIEETRDSEGVCFDKDAGFAIYKDPRDSRGKRYVIFNIQDKKPYLPHHFHNDVLAVYFNCDGEVIFSDQGRYTYDWTAERKYFVSPAAHNVIAPPAFLEAAKASRGGRGLLLATSPWSRIASDKVVFGANVFESYRMKDTLLTTRRRTNRSQMRVAKSAVRRRVTIPKEKSALIVEDVVGSGSPLALIWNIGQDVDRIEPLVSDTEGDGSSHEWRLITKKGKRFIMTIEVEGSLDEGGPLVESIRGGTEPLFGWYAPRFQVKVPSSVIKISIESPGVAWVTTRLVQIE